jgi:hypothetical protein
LLESPARRDEKPRDDADGLRARRGPVARGGLTTRSSAGRSALGTLLHRSVADGDVPAVVAVVVNREQVMFLDAAGRRDVANDAGDDAEPRKEGRSVNDDRTFDDGSSRRYEDAQEANLGQAFFLCAGLFVAS